MNVGRPLYGYPYSLLGPFALFLTCHTDLNTLHVGTDQANGY